MARKLKPQRVGTLYLEKVHADFAIMFDRESLELYIVLGPELTVRASSAAEVKELARKRVHEVMKLEWKAVIRISGLPQGGGYQSNHNKFAARAELDLGICRLEVAQLSANREIERIHVEDLAGLDWDIADIDAWERGDRRANFPSMHCVEIPYDEAVWQQLKSLVEKMQGLVKRLEEVLMKTEKDPAYITQALKKGLLGK